MWVCATTLILLAPIMNWLGELTILVAIESRGVNVILDVPFLVLADKSLDEHFVTLAQGLSADIVLVGTCQVLLTRHQICVADNGIILLGRVTLVAIVETGTLVTKGMILAHTVNRISRQSAFGKKWILAVRNTPASITKEVVHWGWDVSDVLEHVIHHFLELNESPRANLGHFVDVLPISSGNVEKGAGIFTLDFLDFEGIVHCLLIVTSVTMTI